MGNPCDPGGSHPDVSGQGRSELETKLADARVELALALGIVRVLTLLPLHDPSLGEIERHVAKAWESLLDVRRSLADERAIDLSGEGSDQP
jgi:hypothetical protein